MVQGMSSQKLTIWFQSQTGSTGHSDGPGGGGSDHQQYHYSGTFISSHIPWNSPWITNDLVPFSLGCETLETGKLPGVCPISKEKRMRPFQSTTDPQLQAFLQQVSRWPLALRDLHQRIAACFARPEPRRHALLYLQAILSDIPRKNGWQIAEHARLASPSGIQRLLSRAVWDEAAVRDALRSALVQTLLSPAPVPTPTEAEPLFPILVIDESGFPKRGTHSAGVQPQYCGVSGRVENCQVGVFLSYVTALGHGLIDREVYVPEQWCCDPARRQAAHIPASLTFRTKPELAQRMIQRTQSAHLPICWVVADTVYGHCPDLRQWVEEQATPMR